VYGHGHRTNRALTDIFTGEVHDRPAGKIELSLIDAIFEKHPLGSVIFTGLSEPFLAPDRVFYIADKLEAKGGAFAIYSNGALMTEDIIERLLTYKGFKSIHISLNAVTTEVREEVMGNPLFPAESNLLRLLEMRREAGCEENVRVGVCMILTVQSFHQDHAFRSKWSQVFSQYSNCNEPGVFNPTNWAGQAHFPGMRAHGSRYCDQWDGTYPTVSVDGYLYHCCYNAQAVCGHVLDDVALERYFNRRELLGVVKGDVASIPHSICGECTGIKLMSF